MVAMSAAARAQPARRRARDAVTNHQVDDDRSSTTLYGVAVVVLAVLGAVVTFVLSFAGVMASDSCGTSDQRMICTDSGQAVAFWLPWGGWAGAIVIAVVVGVWTNRRWHGPWAALWAAAVFYIGCVVTALIIA